MAHPYKRVKLRVSRSIEQILELQGISENSAENDVIELCVGIMQRAQAAVNNAIVQAERRAKARPDLRKPAAAAPVQRPPAAAAVARPAPPQSPAAGVAEAQPRKPQAWASREAMNHDDDDVRVLPHDSTPAEYVQQCLDGTRGGVHDEMAARELVAMAGWGNMTGEQQVSAIKARALEMAREDEMSDIDETLRRAPGPAAPPPGDGTTF